MNPLLPQYAFSPQFITPTNNSQAPKELGQKPFNAFPATPQPALGLQPTPLATTGVSAGATANGYNPALFAALPSKINNKAGLEGIEDYKNLPGFNLSIGSKLNLMA